MVKFLNILLLALMLVVVPSTYVPCLGQEMKSWTIGDSVQPLVLKGLLGTKDKTVCLDDYRGKGLILDFGSTGCPPCIESLQELTDIMKVFSDDLQVLSVMKDKKDRVQRFLLESPVGSQLSFPVLYEDTLLHALFPHHGQPHLVWIDPNGVIQAITNHHYITHDRIAAFLDGGKLDFPVKWDFEYDPANPLLVLNPNIKRKEMLPASFRSIYISGYMPGVRRSYRIDVDSIRGQVRVQAINQNLELLYMKLLAGKYSIIPSRLVVEGTDPGRFLYSRQLHGPSLEWDLQNRHCFEMYFPLALPEEEQNRRIASYLDDYLNISTSYKMKERTVWIVSAPKEMTQKEIEKGITMRDLFQAINNRPNHPPLQFDPSSSMVGTDFFKGWIVLDMDRIFDFDYLKKELSRQGYELRQERQMVEGLFVISR